MSGGGTSGTVDAGDGGAVVSRVGSTAASAVRCGGWRNSSTSC